MEVVNTNFENWGTYLLKQFQIMYEKGERCDLEISCNKQIFLVHRLVLSACSDYVRDLSDKQHIILPEEISCRTLKTVIDFVYSGKIIFNKEEKEELLLAANLLSMRLLTELIKPEESGPYTLHMDDEEDDNPPECVNNGLGVDHLESSDLRDTYQEERQTSTYLVGSKRKAESRNNKNKHPRQSSVFPPLHKFPYLQQKFSATRTYGLITNFTDPLPWRFEISDVELSNSSYRSTFEDVTYQTEKLFPDPDNLTTLHADHEKFLKKVRDSPSHRRNYSNALYSPFDKYTPPLVPLKSEPIFNYRRHESVISYPSKSDVVCTRKVTTQNISTTPHLDKCDSILMKSTSKLLASQQYRKSNPQTLSSCMTPKHTEKHVRFAKSIDVCEIDVQFAEEQFNMDTLPEPLRPSEIVEGPSTVNDDNVDLIKLSNAVVPSSTGIHAIIDCSEPQTTSLIPFSLVDTSESALAEALAEMKNDQLEMDTDSGSVEVKPETVISNAIDDKNCNHTSDVDIEDITPVLNSYLMEEPADDLCTNLMTPLNNMSKNTTELNSQMFALKVKGSEDAVQLSKLVNICKQNPLFKNKNLRFKIVPVKGAIQDHLKDNSLIGSTVSKAIIVKKSECAIPASESSTNMTNKCTTKESSKIVQKESPVMKDSKLSRVENVSGPWECVACEVSSGIIKKFDTYYDYRTHLHRMHNEANNPIFCIHCGYKSLKRNVQLYHLLSKHNVEPPSPVKFPKCNKCEFYALNEYYLQKHLACHPSMGMEYVCSCKVAFKSSELLQKHMVSGDCKNSKSFTCGYCRCMFDRFVNLKAHMRVCMKERSKPMLENSAERFIRTVSDGGKDYLTL